MRRVAVVFLSLTVACALSFPSLGLHAYGAPLSVPDAGAADEAAGVPAALLPAPASGAESRTYDSKATGAPRAEGRTEATVNALTDAARDATRGYSFGDLVGAGTVPDVVHIAQFGAYGDGEHDDRAALQAAFGSSAKTILFEHGATYKVNSSLMLRRGGVTLLGDSATIVTDADYNDGDERLLSVTGTLPESGMRDAVADNWKTEAGYRNRYYIEDVGIYQLNMASLSYDPATAVSGKQAYSKQLMVQMCVNVDIFDCTFTTEQPKDGRVVDGYTALDAYTGWHDVTIEKCVVRDFCDKSAGGGIWIRDHFDMGSSNMVFRGNDFEKMCHDEILAVFNSNVDAPGVDARPIADVLIVENAFVLYEGTDEDSGSPSVMAFTVKCARDVLIENNDMDVRTTGGLVWSSHSSGVVVRDNDIAQTRSHVSADTDFLMFRDTIDLVESNRMTLKALDETAKNNHRYVFSTSGVTRGNTVVSDLALECVSNGPGLIESNDVRLNAPVHVVFNSNRIVTNNKVELNADVDQYCQYYRTVLSNDVVISDNTFDNRVEGSSHTVLNLNEATMGGHVVRFSNNRLLNSGLGSGARLLFLKLLDADSQEDCVVFSGGEISNRKAYDVYRYDVRHTYVISDDIGSGHAHVWGAWSQTKPPTCTKEGAELRVCDGDASHVATRVIAALGHADDGGVMTRAATEQIEGEVVHTCSRCGEVLYTESIPRLQPREDADAGKGASHGGGPSSDDVPGDAVPASDAGSASGAPASASDGGDGSASGSDAIDGDSDPDDIGHARVTLAKASYVYSGKARKPAVKSVVLDGEKLSAGVDYRVSYSANKNVGKGKVIVTGKGDFAGSKAVSFTIVPKATSISKLVSAKRGFTAKWKKQATQATGYQLQCALTKSFKSKKSFTVAKAKTVSKRVAKLKPEKRYYVRVRTYKKTGSAIYYSAWSKVKAVTTRR